MGNTEAPVPYYPRGKGRRDGSHPQATSPGQRWRRPIKSGVDGLPLPKDWDFIPRPDVTIDQPEGSQKDSPASKSKPEQSRTINH